MSEGTEELVEASTSPRGDAAATDIDQAGAFGQSRRALLAGGGGVCLALLLGACGSSNNTPPAGGTDDGGGDDNPTTAPADSPTSAGGGGGGDVLAKLADVPEGGGLLVAGDVMLVKLNGSIKAYNAHCRHQGFIVDPPKNGIILCENHGSEYKSSDGSVVNGPATQPLIVINVKVDGENIVRA
jgi:Rieske Fe-S protein